MDDLLPVQLQAHANLVYTAFDLALKYESYQDLFDFLNINIQLL